ncbi:MAG: hypothetical protein PHY43_15790 [Verrucomicrobiales bacterium]|nr:hypothetical protein [Verrucomicrobiales bacterium]
MDYKHFNLFWPCVAAAGLLFSDALTARAEDTNLTEQVRLLREQNALLQQQLQKQGRALDALTQKVQGLEAANSERDNSASDNSTPTKGGLNFGKVNLGAEGGIAFFDTGSEGFAPNSEFRVDEARVFLDAPVWEDVYFYGEINLATRENTDLYTQLGQLYLDFEDVSKLWGKDGQFNVRAGRIEVPFGEEYLTRNAIDNPLILHSVADLWAVDPGVEIYGTLGKFSYVVAVQNGGGNGVQDFTGDKSVAGRISFDPNRRWHFSVSGMTTGNVDVQDEYISAEWFGNGWFRSIGSTNTTQFYANLVEGDLTARWAGGHVSAFGGYVHYDDNDPSASNTRDVYYYSIEVVQNLPRKFYAATRFSEVFAHNGVPIVGSGNFDEYFNGPLTTELWRWSVGLGCRFCDRLVLKTEYAFEGGTDVGGGSRNEENFFGTEVAFKF